jgi:polyphenol oxidase
MKSNFRTASEDIAGKIFSAMASMEELILVVPVAVLLIVYSVEALPFPAPNLQNCLTSEECCTPVLFDGEARKFQFQAHLQLRVRPAAHLVDDAYVAKYQRATERMRALPDTDGRSFHNQYKLHCAYCDNHLYFAGSVQQYPLEIHGSWLFFPWHRLYLYFYERILAKLIDDDAFALPFWNWDNQSPTSPLANVVPRLYAEETSSINKTSSLYDPDRTDCAKRPGGFVNFQDFSTCPVGHANASLIRATNAHIVYVNMVAGGVTPLAFHGRPYRLGDQGGGGPGSIEGTPHGPVHSWVNTKQATFKDSASDPIFFAHHANVDRLWNLWKTLPGGARHDISDPDYLNTLFTFYNEDGALVTASVAQALQIDQLR